MSNLFGIYSTASENLSEQLHTLGQGNLPKSCHAEQQVLFDHIGIGCKLEHFTDRYPAGSPILSMGTRTAAIDAVLYNREELLKEIHEENPNPSDEELLLSYVTEQGYEALHKVNGDFAGAVYDSETHTLTLFRDHMGIRPLYYYLDAGVCLFSTDLRALAGYPGIDTGISEAALFRQAMGYNPQTACETHFRNLQLVAPASYMTVTAGERKCDPDSTTPEKASRGILQMQTTAYWTLGSKKVRYRRKEDYRKQLYALVEDAIRRRSDAMSGIIGGELSGGLDSGVIAAFLGDSDRESLFYSWSASPEEQPLLARDERQVVLDLCKEKGLRCQFSTSETYQARQDFESTLTQTWPPFINTINILEGSLYLHSRGVNGVFSGHGGDEGISHRANPYELWYHREYPAFFRYFFQQKKGTDHPLLRALHAIWYQLYKVNPGRKAPKISPVNAESYLRPAFRERMKAIVRPAPLYFSYDAQKYIDNGGSRKRLETTALLGAAAGVHYLFPYLDYRVIDFAVSIPRSEYLDGYEDRKLFRETFRDRIPKSLVQVDYKDIPSMMEHDPYTAEQLRDLSRYQTKRIHTLVELLNRELWDPYLDIDKLLAIEFSDAYTESDRSLVYELAELLNITLLMQDLLLHERKTARD